MKLFILLALFALSACGAQPGNPLRGPLIGQIDNTDWAAISQATGDLMRKK